MQDLMTASNHHYTKSEIQDYYQTHYFMKNCQYHCFPVECKYSFQSHTKNYDRRNRLSLSNHIVKSLSSAISLESACYCFKIQEHRAPTPNPVLNWKVPVLSCITKHNLFKRFCLCNRKGLNFLTLENYHIRKMQRRLKNKKTQDWRRHKQFINTPLNFLKKHLLLAYLIQETFATLF